MGLGRRLLAGPVANSGLLPAVWYRHLALAAMEEEDFPQALEYLKWAEDPLLVQILIFRLRLLQARHRETQETVRHLLKQTSGEGHWEKVRALAEQEDRALELLSRYEAEALEIVKNKKTGIKGGKRLIGKMPVYSGQGELGRTGAPCSPPGADKIPGGLSGCMSGSESLKCNLTRGKGF